MLTVIEGETDRASAPAGGMSPVSFGGCFGWFHAPAEGLASDTAVVLCRGLKNDGLTAHRSFRLLADAVSRAGYPTLRFDYPGAGDSCDIDGAEYWAVCRRSIHTAADWLREHCGVTRIVLCGLRFGATLAAVVAGERRDVAGLILLEPVLRGRTYLRQLTVEAGLPPAVAARDGLVVHELQLSAETVRLIGDVDLRRVALTQGCEVAVYAEAPSPVLSECADAWRQGGAAVMWDDFAGLEAMLRPSFMSHEAPAKVARIAAWLRQAVPARPVRRRPMSVPTNPELRPPGCVETPLRFGAAGSLFGVLCRPAARAGFDAEPCLVVVIASASGDPHYGFARAAVNLARRLAAEGIASLRMDFAGLGDSVAPGDAVSHVFETDRRRDIAAAIDALARLGYHRFAIHGVCSGAYHGFHAALSDPRVSVLLLVNLPMFQWRAGVAIELLSQVVQRPSHLLRHFGRKDLWKLLLQGKLDLRRRLWFPGTGRRLVGRFNAQARFARDSMRHLAPRVRTLFLVSEGDAAVETLAQAFGPNRAPQGATIRVLPDFDHSLSGRAMQNAAADHIIEFLIRDQAAEARAGRHRCGACLTSNAPQSSRTRPSSGAPSPTAPTACI